ncbi:MAG: hypothetical protein RTS72_03390 [Candidatus Thorarchaeota archaeon]
MRHDSSYHSSAEGPLTSSRTHKKSTGTYYTPEPLASMIAHDSIFAWLSGRNGKQIQQMSDLESLKTSKQKQLLNDIMEVSILDPAVGDGVFLTAAGDWLSKILVTLGDNRSEKMRRRSIVKSSLHGVDLAKDAVNSCIQRLEKWSNIATPSELTNFKIGNSLVGLLDHENRAVDSTQEVLNNTLSKMMSSRKSDQVLDDINDAYPLHWHLEFPTIFSGSNPGFDIVLGNPPYGSILGPIERLNISSMYPFSVGGSRTGTWNSAAHFLVRSMSLMKKGAQLGFLVPNSFLRVKQFSKTRDFLLNHTKLWKIIDEGSPFNDVTLEMVSLFCELAEVHGEYKINVESRRHGLEQSNVLSSQVLKESRVFPIYHDHILAKILKRGQKGLLVAGRGRDIPKKHVHKKQTPKFKTPYITSGRSVQRYGLKAKHVVYADDWFRQNSALKNSFENEFLVATKNYRYPRCILKPRGMIHGGGIVKITPLYLNADLKVLGLILNSKLVKQISIRYLTNYSQLTCCLNTGIMEDLPLVLPKQPQVYRDLFDILSHHYSDQSEHTDRENIPTLEKLTDALVYSLYFGDEGLEQRVSQGINDLNMTAQEQDVVKMIEEILNDSIVKELERMGSFPASRKLRRY